MISVRLFGGLGNQMFQYALGISLAHRYQVPLVVDRSEFSENYDKNTLRPYELHNFKAEVTFLDENKGNPFKITESEESYRIFRRLIKFLPFGFRKYYVENSYAFSPAVFDCKGVGYFDGYWQSPKYFTGAEDLIRESFQPRKINDQSTELLAKISNVKSSVSLHVRRGDYVTNKHANQHHGVCSLDYYQRAISLLKKEATNLEFFLFSDDPNWVRENLKLEFPVTVVDFNGPDFAYLDMYMMSKCRYHIIANSSFSWWGAWLAGADAKKVVAPRKWFQSNVSTNDLIVDGWILL